MAASTCSHNSCARAICTISAIGSKAVVAVRAAGRDDRAGFAPGCAIRRDGRGERVGAHVEVVVDGNHAQVLAAEAREQRRLFHRAVGLRRYVHDERVRLALQPAARGGVVGGALARADQRDERRRRGGVLDHARPARGQPEHLAPPVEAHLFELGQRRTCLPVEPELPQARAHQVAEHGRRQTVRREVAVKARILPVRAGRQDQLIEIAADGGEILGFLRWRRWQCVAQRTGSVARHHRKFLARDALAIVRDPVDELVTGAAKLLGGHGGSPHFLAKGVSPRT